MNEVGLAMEKFGVSVLLMIFSFGDIVSKNRIEFQEAGGCGSR